ncbi:MAG: tRNA (guanosine(37)-N1)-methyltransferase TrmD [Actinomycetaceae bacterium]|nr:tRNA (guanosine(37)-N1)-methyltransferase TrmD [Actinomycetaceae bacterium]
MRFDILTVFPEFFSILDVSLVGKAQEKGLLEVDVHDLREWTTDVHRTVDDTPFGGGAGMVMKPDVWAKAIDDVVGQGGVVKETLVGGEVASGARDTVLAIPTPAGQPLTQAMCYELAQAEHIVVACGRYEGLDARVAEYYSNQPGMRVFEYSLGDYVLNGGEIAAMALIEATARLIPGMVGNPESLVEESHGEAGLLEYPVFTRPAEFRGLAVPPVLLSGNHGAIARWRRDRALERTAQRRPDMIAKLTNLDRKDRATLATQGWLQPRGDVGSPRVAVVRPARIEEAPEIAALAARTFPDACPPEVTEEDQKRHIANHLTPDHFAAWIMDSELWGVHVLEVAGDIVGYSLVKLRSEQEEIDEGAPLDVTIDGVQRDGDLTFLSKIYLDRAWRGTGAFKLLMDQAIEFAQDRTADQAEPFIWLGTNAGNKRAIKAYEKAGFVVVGTRTFIVGDVVNKDVTLARRLRKLQ